MKPHKHKDLIIAWANGATVQTWVESAGKWIDNLYPHWIEADEYRIRPENKTIAANKTFDLHFRCHTNEIGKITKVEVLNG